MNKLANCLRMGLAVATAVACLASTAIAASNSVLKDRKMNTNGNEQWRTHCVGRFLIDLPADAEYVGGSYDYAFATVERKTMDRDAFHREVDAFERRLRDTNHDSGTSLLLKSGSPKETIKVFGYWDSKDQRIGVDISGYSWIDGQRYLLHKGASPNKVEAAVARMSATMSKLQGREGDTPSTPGFCVEQALFADANSSSNESLNIRFRLKSHPDIAVDIATNLNAGDPPESLLSRKPGVLSALGMLGATLGGIRNIKEGDRIIGDHPGQEWLMKAPNDHGQQAHLFTWEAPGLHADELHPQIRIDLQSGNSDGGLDPKPISMTDQQMLQLWDKILNSWRLRPTDGSKDASDRKTLQQSNNSDVVPLGDLVRTGAICPQTGYWQCPENDVHGSTRLFQAGAPMPPAIVRRDLSFVERLRGSSDQHSASTVWRLVRYDNPGPANAPTPVADDGTVQPPRDV